MLHGEKMGQNSNEGRVVLLYLVSQLSGNSESHPSASQMCMGTHTDPEVLNPLPMTQPLHP